MSQEKLKKLIEKSKLNQEQKELWYNFIDNVTEEEIAPILETLEENPEQLNFLTENLKSKIEVFQTKDKKLSDNILAEEKKYIEEQF